MKSYLLPSKALILLAAACLVWIVLISAVVMCFTGIASPAAWILAGALLCGVVLSAFIISAEYRNAIDLTETCAPNAGNRNLRFRAEVDSTELARRVSSSGLRSCSVYAEVRAPGVGFRNRIVVRRRHRPGRKSIG